MVDAWTLGVPAALALLFDGALKAANTLAAQSNAGAIRKFRSELRRFPALPARYAFLLPAFRNPEQVDRSVAHLKDVVGIPPDSILVVDDASEDDGRTLAAAAKHGVRTMKFPKEQKRLPKMDAQRAGAELLREDGLEFIVALDSDSYISATREDLEYAMTEMNLLGLDAMAARIMPCQLSGTLLERLQEIEYDQSMVERRAGYRIREVVPGPASSIEDLSRNWRVELSYNTCVSGAFGIFRPDAFLRSFEAAKPWARDDDMGITFRLMANGGKIGISAMTVLTEVPCTLRELAVQRVSWSVFIGGVYLNAPFRGRVTRHFSRKSFAIAANGALSVWIHPVKLAGLPFLLFNPLGAATMIFTYMLLALAGMFVGQKRDPLAAIVQPFVKVAEMIGPSTVGYAKVAWREMRSIFQKPPPARPARPNRAADEGAGEPVSTAAGSLSRD